MATAQSKLHGLGRRKSAIAQVNLVPDVATRVVNGSPFEAYFPTVGMQAAALAALAVTSQTDQWGFQAKLRGGGKLGQADALKLALARALVAAEPGFHKQLRDAGLLTRDARVKERKKPGLKRARRAPQFSKR